MEKSSIKKQTDDLVKRAKRHELEAFTELMQLYMTDMYKVAYAILMNDEFIDPLLVNVALSHMQFETIHAYKDGNGRLGRALIPVQMSMLDHSTPILYMSEILELYKPSYQRHLMECRRGNAAGYIKFFLQCVIDQCNAYIIKIERMKEIYREDMETIKAIKGNSVYRIMPVIIKQIVFTKKEVQEISGVSVNVVSSIINQLVDLKVIVPDPTMIKKGYRYQKIYDVFVGTYGGAEDEH